MKVKVTKSSANIIAAILLGLAARGVTTAWAAPATPAAGMVATVQPLATDAGVDALRRGGNAVDAAVAAALTLGVVDGYNSGIGGGCFILLRLADGSCAAIDGRETAPRGATREMYIRDGKPQSNLSQTGPLASGVPGALAAYDTALRRWGRLKLADVLRPAADLAERGFLVTAAYEAKLRSEAKNLARFSGSRAVLLKSDGSPYAKGEILKQPDLAKTYRAVAEQGIDWFYRGRFAQEVERWMANHGGLLTAADFVAYQARPREPLVTTYRGYTIVGFPPPSSGGVHVAEILNILEPFDLQRLHREAPAKFYHVVAEAMKLAFADRAYWLGDPDFVPVPRGLVDKQYARQLARRIDLDRVTPVPTHGRPPRTREDLFGGKHTTHIAVADAEGNWVAITATINTTFGSKVIVPGTGVVLNDEMDDFSIAPGVPNFFGLVGAEANAVAPGKRPLSSMSPTVVLQDGRPVLTLGAAGGPGIITAVVMTLLYRLDLGMDLADALASPRIHHQWQPDRLWVEAGLEPSILDALKQLGHSVASTRSMSVGQAIGLAPDGRTFIGVHDPRVEGKAAGWSRSGAYTIEK